MLRTARSFSPSCFMQAGPQRIHCIILATVLELCENPNTLPHILTWRDKARHTAPRILLQLWKEEEAELKVSRNQHGGIAGKSHILYTVCMNICRTNEMWAFSYIESFVFYNRNCLHRYCNAGQSLLG